MATLTELITQLRRNREEYVVFVPSFTREDRWGVFTMTDEDWGVFNLRQFGRLPLLTTLGYFADAWPRAWTLEGRIIRHIAGPVGHAVRDPRDVQGVLRRFRRIRARGWDLTSILRVRSWEPVLVRPHRTQAARRSATPTEEEIVAKRIIPASDPNSASSSMPKSSQVPTRFEREDPLGDFA